MTASAKHRCLAPVGEQRGYIDQHLAPVLSWSERAAGQLRRHVLVSLVRCGGQPHRDSPCAAHHAGPVTGEEQPRRRLHLPRAFLPGQPETSQSSISSQDRHFRASSTRVTFRERSRLPPDSGMRRTSTGIGVTSTRSALPPELHLDRRDSHPLVGVETRYAHPAGTLPPHLHPTGQVAGLGGVCGGSTLTVSSDGMRIHRIG